ncbi:MAG: metallophosphoesterase [Gammaproteobacteria bacterium]|nr:MAG: metallophosphoesterase [Gammaproteobacteria bacterium]
MRSPPPDPALVTYLAPRIGADRLAARLAREAEWERRVLGTPRRLLYVERWYSLQGWMRGLLRLAGLHARGRRNARRIALRHHRVALTGLPGVFAGYRILHLSDLHLDLAPDLPAAIARAVRGVDCDCCVLTGDFRALTFGPWQASVEGLAQVLEALAAPVYAVLGNHDSLCMVPAMEAMGVRVLLNESTCLERGGEKLVLAGVDDPHFHRAHDIDTALREVPPGAVRILLAHSPECWLEAARAGVDLYLCGHTHGGQICLPGGIPILRQAACPRALTRGPWRWGRMQGYTSPGTGSSVIDVRLNCPPEVTLHELRPA